MRTTMFAALMAVLATYTLSAIAEPPPRLRVLGTYESGLFNVGGANSVDTRFGILVVAVEADPKQDDGYIAFYSTFTLKLLGVAPAGALPDMVTFSDDGRYVLAASEGDARDNDGDGYFDKLFALGARSFSIWKATTGALVGLERIGGILVLDLSDPKGSSSCPSSKARMARHS